MNKKTIWQTKKIGDVAKICLGLTHTPKYVETGVPFLSVKDISQGHINFNHTRFITENEFNSMPEGAKPKKGDVLFCRVGTIGYPQIVDSDGKFGIFVSLGFFRVNEMILQNKYIAYWMMSPQFDSQVKKNVQGSTLKNLNTGWLKNFDILLPSLSEQQQIVKILDEAFESIAKAKSIAEKNLQNSKKILESYLYNVFIDGKNGWVEKRLCDICEKITDGTHQTPTYFSDGIIFLSSRNVTSGKINWNDIKYIDDKQHQEMHKRVAPRLNDILLAKNGTTGVAAMVDRDETFDIYVSLALLRPKEMVIPQFLLHFVNSPAAKKQFNKRLKGIGVPNLHLEEIREVEIKFPESKAEQMEIVSHINDLLSKTKKLESIYQQKLADLEELKKSILNKAFNGEL